MAMTFEELAGLIDKHNKKLRVNELRTSMDGGLDFSANYWCAKQILICIDEGMYVISSKEDVEGRSSLFDIQKADYVDKTIFPFVIKTDRVLFHLTDYEIYALKTGERNEVLHFVYDSCEGLIHPESTWAGVGLSLQELGNEDILPGTLEYVAEEYIYTWNFLCE